MTASHNEIKAQLQSVGFYQGTGWTDHDALNLANSLGNPIGDFGDPRLVRRISPQTKAAAKENTLSKKHGIGAFPFHTETAYWLIPARYLLLRCVHPGTGRRPTFIVDSCQWELSASNRRSLTSEVFKVAGRKFFLANLATPHGDRLAWRFDRDCMVPVTNGADQAFRTMTIFLDGSQKIKINWIRGMLLLIDNHRCLHARGTARSTDKNRVLERILIGGDS